MKRTSTRLRALWKDLPDDLVMRAKGPRRVTDADAEANYAFRATDRGDPIDIVQRVCGGGKPMGTLLLRAGREIRVAQSALNETCRALGLQHEDFFQTGGRREAAIFLPDATLGQYYDQAAVIARYREEAGVVLDPALFATPIHRFARGVVSGELPEAVKYPLLGLCLGYPIADTIALVKNPP